ncbi:hypothetical protein AVEN_219268-1 [Araneus ventricosus]|uniref:Uncharacterized protein n=1 Tax=Araneus ventricosus TaxID=182803 RepID=A0A4Y2PK90_ARAVE|nr:hypothetical protein AVEN_219268-1 [Araneus ventricosus]
MDSKTAYALATRKGEGRRRGREEKGKGGEGEGIGSERQKTINVQCQMIYCLLTLRRELLSPYLTGDVLVGRQTLLPFPTLPLAGSRPVWGVAFRLSSSSQLVLKRTGRAFSSYRDQAILSDHTL